jgi:hypothetical protein
MPTSKFPLVDIPDSGGQYIGSVSNLISAALQTAGLYLQSDVLNNFVGILQGLGVLLFLVAIIGAISSYVITGMYKQAAFFLITPSIFWALLMFHCPAQPTLLQVGNRVQPGSAQDQLTFLSKISETDFYKRKPEVSWFFAKFDNLISTIVQSTVSFLIDEENKKDLIAVAREKVLSEVFSARAADKDFVKLVSMGMLGECAELSRRSEELANIDADLKTLAASKLPTLGNDVSRLTARRNLLLPRIELLKNQSQPLDPGVKEYVWATLGVDRPNSATCLQIWNYTRDTSLKEAERALALATSGDESKSGIPWAKVKADVATSITRGQPRRVDEVVAAYIFKNTMEKNTHTALMNQMLSHSPLEEDKYQLQHGFLMDAQGQGELLSTQYFAGIIPYTQGLLLFILTATFPFFCLLILLPSRTPSLFVWCGLWVWVKSWDVGFALIQFVRELLWIIFCRNVSPDPALLDWSDLSSVFNIIARNDPFVGLGLYNTLINLLTISVPFVTAHMCLGGTALFSSFRTAIDQTVSRVSGQHSGSARRRYATIIEGKWRQERESAGLRRAYKAIENGGGSTAKIGEKESFQRWMGGDGLLNRRVQEEYHKGMADFDLSERSEHLMGQLAGVTGRPVVLFKPIDHSSNIVGALVNNHNERFEARGVFDAHGSHITGSLQQALGMGGTGIFSTGNQNTGYDTPTGGASSKDLDGAGGGGPE